MKRTICLILAAVFLFAFAGCGKTYTAADLSAYLDAEGFVPGMSQTAFIAKAEKIEGKTFSEHARHDEEQGGGWRGYGKNATYVNDYQVNDEEGFVVYSNSIGASAKPKGLKMPAKIRFSDALEEVLKKLSIDADPANAFTPDSDESNVMTLYAEGGVTLKLTDCRRDHGETAEETPDAIDYSYILEFLESSTQALSDGRTETVTRTIRFYFTENSGMQHFIMRVSERYPTRQSSAN